MNVVYNSKHKGHSNFCYYSESQVLRTRPLCCYPLNCQYRKHDSRAAGSSEKPPYQHEESGREGEL